MEILNKNGKIRLTVCLVLGLVLVTACQGSQYIQITPEPISTTDLPSPSPTNMDLTPSPNPTMTPAPTTLILPPVGGDRTDPYTPLRSDLTLNRGTVYLDTTEISVSDGVPVQISLNLSGNLPTPCDQLRVAFDQPDSENRIFIEVYSVSSSDTMCIQVLHPFDASISLGRYPTGHYTVYVNGEQTGEFTS